MVDKAKAETIQLSSFAPTRRVLISTLFCNICLCFGQYGSQGLLQNQIKACHKIQPSADIHIVIHASIELQSLNFWFTQKTTCVAFTSFTSLWIATLCNQRTSNSLSICQQMTAILTTEMYLLVKICISKRSQFAFYNQNSTTRKRKKTRWS